MVTVMTPPLAPPSIVGVADFYTPGDLVDINCTSLESKPAASLKWLINEQKVRNSCLQICLYFCLHLFTFSGERRHIFAPQNFVK